tara:strand:+ start:5159 stop:7093 length:1935 start_codon:yes stop_codon:yes gene_type:complete
LSVKKVEPNPYYPLPADYASLTEDGQRQARVNACRQWLLGGTPADKGNAFVASLKFFDRYYLNATEDFDPLFYDDEPLPSPQGHFDILSQWASSNRNIAIAPRGFAKSFLVRKATLLRLLSRNAFTILYATSTNDNAKGTGQAIKDQLQNNMRLLDDWNKEAPDNRLIPKRGEAPFGTEMMQLRNGSWLRCISAESRQRGGRPRRYVLDDPEYDPKASTSMSVLRSYMDNLLFKVVLPMVMRRGCGVDWLATFVSRRHYAWHALQTNTNEDGSKVATDPRFNLWSRMIIRAAYEDESGKIHSCWPDMWPPDKQYKKDHPELQDRISLEEIREIIGTPNFLAEYMARPGESSESYFPQLEKDKHGWWLEDVDPLIGDTPRESETLICWRDHKEMLHKYPMHEFLNSLRLFMTVDTSYTSSADSDYKVACVMGVNSANTLFVLDIFSQQCKEEVLIKNIFLLADKWKVPTVHPEAIKTGLTLCNTLSSMVSTGMVYELGVNHVPGIKKLNPGMVDKASKISSLHHRFENNLIKFPLFRRNQGVWNRLLDQVEEFNPDARDGGLQHDDEIDCVAMSQYVIKGRLHKSFANTRDTRTALEKMEDGEIMNEETNTPLIYEVNLSSIPVALVSKLMDNQQGDRNDGSSRV